MIFDKRRNYKPFEYPEVNKFIDAMDSSFWVHSEVPFTSDVQDYHTQLTDSERLTIKRTLLAIAQIEVDVKRFWGDLYKTFPKPEFNNLGSCFAYSETRHSEAYSQLIEVLGYNDEFKGIIEEPVIKKRIEYLSNALKRKDTPSFIQRLLIKLNLKKDTSKEDYVLSIILFSILIENVSLFSQFAIMYSFTHFKGLLQNISNIIAWTSNDEQIHAFGGMYIINNIRKEFPDMFTPELEARIHQSIDEAMEVEGEILTWIFNGKKGVETISKQNLLNFMKNRVDQSLVGIGYDKKYDLDDKELAPMAWFDEEIIANTLDDFFAKRPVDYSKHNTPITHEDLF